MTTPLTPERFLDVDGVLAATVSPNGEHVAFVTEAYDAEASERKTALRVVDTDGSGDTHRLTRSGSVSIPRWSPSGDRLAFIGTREGDADAVTDGPEKDDPHWTGSAPEDNAQVWMFDIAHGGDPTRVTAFPEGAEDYDWGPDGDRLVVAARDPTEAQAEYLRDRRDEETPAPAEVTRLQHKADGYGYTDEVETYLFVVDRETGAADRLDDANAGAGINAIHTGPQPRWSPTGDRIAFLGNHTDAGDDTNVYDAYTIRPDGTDLQKLTDSDVTASSLAWNPEGNRLSMVVRDPVNWYEPTNVAVADTEAGTFELISTDMDRHVAEVGWPTWVDDDTVLAGIADEAQVRLACFDAAGGGERVFDDQGAFRTVDAFDVSGGTALLLLSDPQDGDDLYAVDADLLAAGDPVDLTRLSAINKDVVDDFPTPDVHRVVAEGDEDHTVESVVATPQDFDPDGTAPLLIQIHGGPIWHDTTRFSFEDAFWTSRGYVVMHPNYRGSYGYGREFCESIRGDWGSREVADIVAGVDELVDREWVDDDRVFATGFSYGGITTGWLLTRTDRLAAGAPEAGVYDFYSAYGTDQWHEWTKNEFGVPWENAERFRELSSINEVDDVDAPVLVTAGGADWNCPPTQAEQFHVSLKKAGKESKLVIYPDEPHRRLYQVERPSYVIHRLNELESWFADHDPGR